MLTRGVGANCVHPLLASKLLGWKCYGSELLEESLSYARKLYVENELGSGEELVLGSQDWLLPKDIPDK
jgi:23S rRNA A1618 N6-methylase RlmF